LKKKMTAAQKRYVALSCSFGCVVCGAPAEYHHLPGARTVNAYTAGYPLCPEHHRGQEYPGQSIHSSRLLFFGKHGDEFVLMEKNLLRVLAELKNRKYLFRRDYE